MAMEFANDTTTYKDHIGATQQFMSGSSFLVAPMYTTHSIRDGIYLPAGDWVDYWDWSSIQKGPTTVNGYDAPLEKMPMFVRAGAIIPMWPEMSYAGEKPVDTLTLDVYPAGQTTFTLYEDDGKTREALEQDAFARTKIRCSAGPRALFEGGAVAVKVGATDGVYKGQLLQRGYSIQVHAPAAPSTVMWHRSNQSTALEEQPSLSDLEKASSGWYFGTARHQARLRALRPHQVHLQVECNCCIRAEHARLRQWTWATHLEHRSCAQWQLRPTSSAVAISCTPRITGRIGVVAVAPTINLVSITTTGACTCMRQRRFDLTKAM